MYVKPATNVLLKPGQPPCALVAVSPCTSGTPARSSGAASAAHSSAAATTPSISAFSK